MNETHCIECNKIIEGEAWYQLYDYFMDDFTKPTCSNCANEDDKIDPITYRE